MSNQLAAVLHLEDFPGAPGESRPRPRREHFSLRVKLVGELFVDRITLMAVHLDHEHSLRQL